MGRVQFNNSCSEAVEEKLNLAVATLHSFGYRRAAQLFEAVAKEDPSCGIAEWGVAMSHYRQLWDPPTPADLKAGLDAVENGRRMGSKTQRERDYLTAIEVIYKDSDRTNHRTRVAAYQAAMEALTARYPKDREAAIFYALALIANAPASDKTYAAQKRANQILEPILAEQPEHPGLAHYVIHADDHPALASRALDAARRYAKIAPDAPHALHMPSHIFTRLGLWDESVESNLASAASAQRQSSAGDQLHAMDYLVYAYLQTGRVKESGKLVRELPRVQPGDAAYYAGLYATAAIPARYAVERHQWREAAALHLPPDTFPGGPYVWTEANLYFARALGAARLGDVHAAQRAQGLLRSVRDTLLGNGDKYSADQVAIQLETVSAWITFVEGAPGRALDQLRAAADHEDTTEIAAVTPGAIVPVRELLGDMLLQEKHATLAFQAFESVLKVSPGRFRSLYGAGRSAQLAGLNEKAELYYRRLLSNCQQADPSVIEVLEARKFLDRK
jgi:tetratricopeptide (TPR) repeat protein